ncbi:hypothetical protein QHF83_26145 [Polyangium sp. 15x6]|nr:hypothetical protein [Polyangium sp. 15x6]
MGRQACRAHSSPGMQIIARIVTAGGILLLTGGCSPAEDTYLARSAETTRAGDVAWARVFPVGEDPPMVNGEEVHPAVTGLALGPDGDIWIAGTFAGSMDLGAGTISAEQRKAAFVARLDPSGRTRWSTPIHSVKSMSEGVAVDQAGNVFVSGVLDTNDEGHFLEKLAPGGTVLWRRPLPFQTDDAVVSVDVITPDGAGGAVIVGWFDGHLRVGGMELIRGVSSFAVGLGAEGEARWTQKFGQSSDDGPVRAVTGSEGSVIVVEDNAQGSRAPLTKLDRSGGVMWRKLFRRWSPPASERGDVDAYTIAVDADDNVLFAGAGPADLGNDPVMNPFGGPWIVKLTPQGELIWRKDRDASLLGADAAGDVRLVSRTEHGFSAARLNVYGDPVWTRPFPNGGRPVGMVVERAGRMIVAGTFHGTIDLGGGAITSGERDAIFVAALAP